MKINLKINPIKINIARYDIIARLLNNRKITTKLSIKGSFRLIIENTESSQ